MLRNFRNTFKSNRLSVAAVMGVLTIGLLAYLVPSGAPSAVTPESVLGRVYGREIKQREIDQSMNVMLAQFGQGGNQEQLRNLLQSQAIQNVIQEKLFEEVCEREHIVVTDGDIRSTLEGMLLEEGKRQPILLQFLTSEKRLKSMETLIKEFGEEVRPFVVGIEKDARREALRSRLFSLYGAKVPVSSERLEVERRLQEQKINLETVTITPDPTTIGDAADTVLQAYLQSHGAAFRQGKRRIIQVVSVGRDQLDPITLTDQDIQSFYVQQKATFARPAQMRARHILFKASSPTDLEVANKKARALIVRLNQGEKFEDLAVKESEDTTLKASKGDLGWFDAGKMVKEFSDAAFALKVGQISGPVQTSYGIHLIKSEGYRPEAVPPFEEVKERLRYQLLETRYAQKSKEKLEIVRKKSGKGDLKAAAAAVGLAAKESRPFTDNDAPVVEGIFNVGDLGRQAFEIKTGVVSEPLLFGSTYIIYRVSKELPEGPGTLEDLRPKLMQAWKLEQAQAALLKTVQDLRSSGWPKIKSLGTASNLKDVTLGSQEALMNHEGIKQALLVTPVGAITDPFLKDDGSVWCAQLNARGTLVALAYEDRLQLIDAIKSREAAQMIQSEIRLLFEEGNRRKGFRSLWGYGNGVWLDEKALGIKVPSE